METLKLLKLTSVDLIAGVNDFENVTISDFRSHVTVQYYVSDIVFFQAPDGKSYILKNRYSKNLSEVIKEYSNAIIDSHNEYLDKYVFIK